MYDFIGDIHGHADSLELLLQKLGYEKSDGVYAHPKRKVFFLGDFIDRGPKIKETLQIAKSMVDAGNALSVMGNHEYNAIAFHTKDNFGNYLRSHSDKNTNQHRETLSQFDGDKAELEMYIQWFKTLPIFYEDESCRVVHACWDAENIELLKQKLNGNVIQDDSFQDILDKNNVCHKAVEESLKGKELSLPADIFFSDKDGTKRSEIRIKWWEDAKENTYRSYGVHFDENIPELTIENAFSFYPYEDKPVFFGHYWLTGAPKILKENICCLDYSIAKGGQLIAYRFHNEEKLTSDHIVFV